MQGLPPPLHPAKAQGALPQLFKKNCVEKGGCAAALPGGGAQRLNALKGPNAPSLAERRDKETKET